jgi:hypothetical protein
MRYQSWKKIVWLLGFFWVLSSSLGMAFEGGGVASSANEICSVKTGSVIPQVSLRNLDGSLFDLNRAVSKKPTVIIFYRGGW